MTVKGARIIVTDAEWAPAVAVIRSLARAGAVVMAAGPRLLSPGLLSRHAAARVRHRSLALDPDGAVEEILAAARRFHADLVIPLTDRSVVALSGALERFRDVCPLALPDAAALELSRDKAATLDLARSLGLAVPQTVMVRTVEEAQEATGSVSWPVVLKPQYSHQAVGDGGMETFPVAFAACGEELVQKMALYEGRCAVLLQEFVPGRGEGVELLLHRGRTLAAFQHRRLREFPPTGGTSSLRQSVGLHPTFYQQARALLQAMGWTGLAMVEFRVDDGEARLMEVNGRIWGSLPLAVESGMDFPVRLAELYLDGPPDEGPVAATYTEGVRVRNLGLELRWIISVARQRFPHRFQPLPRRRHALSAALELMRPGNRFDVQSWRDPLPGVVDALQQVAHLGHRLLPATDRRVLRSRSAPMDR